MRASKSNEWSEQRWVVGTETRLQITAYVSHSGILCNGVNYKSDNCEQIMENWIPKITKRAVKFGGAIRKKYFL